ncbi:MAG: hypothetical protein ACE5K2_07095 [Candidatus Zixiibacteriota bacterium]
MKNPFKKISIIALILLLSAVVFVFGQTQTEPESKKEKTKSDTAEIQEDKLPSKAVEIRIDQEGIYIRTEEGKELEVGEKETEEGIIIDEEGIKIGDLDIDLKQLKNLEIPHMELPSIKKSKKVYIISHDIVKMGRDIVVEEYEEVDGDVVAVGGDVTVEGTVTGDVVAVGGDIFVASDGVIERDAVSIGGDVEKEPGAVIRGERVGISCLTGLPFIHMVRFAPFLGSFQGLALFARIVRIMIFLFLGIVVISIVPKNVAKVKDRIRQDLLKSALVGFAAEILILPIFILLIVTIIGIPVALLVEPLLILVALILGYTGVSYFIGEKLRESTSLKPETPMMTLVIGILAVESVLLLARFVGLFEHFLFAFSLILTLIGWMIWYVAITVGFGASILTRLGTRPKEVKSVEAPTKPSNSTTGDNKPS